MKGLPSLTPKQLAYAHARLAGKNQADSFREARPKSRLSRNALFVEAHRLENNAKVRAYIDRGLAEQRKDVLLTRDKKRQILGDIALDRSAPKNSRIMAVKVDNEMTGDNAPVRVEGEITLFGIFKALTPATTLPTPEEIIQLKNPEPLRLVEALPPVPGETAMERAGG